MNKNVPKRIVIYPKDITNILGKKKTAAQSMMHRMRRKLGKTREEFITVEEFCQIAGLNPEKIYPLLKN